MQHHSCSFDRTFFAFFIALSFAICGAFVGLSWHLLYGLRAHTASLLDQSLKPDRIGAICRVPAHMSGPAALLLEPGMLRIGACRKTGLKSAKNREEKYQKSIGSSSVIFLSPAASRGR
jgi:hypothetical protein